MAKVTKKRAKQRPRISIDEEVSRKEKFLVDFRKWGLRSKALQESDITLSTLKKWLDADTVFRGKFDLIMEELSIERQDILEEAAFHRALIRSDVLMKLLLQYLDPGYRDKVETIHGGKVQVMWKDTVEGGEGLNLDKL